MVLFAAVAAVLGTINAIIGIFNGLPTSYSGAGRLMSDKWEKEGERQLKRFITYLHYVERKVQEEAQLRHNSKCSETKVKADLKPLDGELEEARSIARDWRDKKRLGKRLESKKFIEKLEKSKKAISERLREFMSYTCREETKQHTDQAAKLATQRTNKTVNNVIIKGNAIINGNFIYARNSKFIHGSPALRENGNRYARNSNLKSGSPALRENGNRYARNSNLKSPALRENGNRYARNSNLKSGSPALRENGNRYARNSNLKSGSPALRENGNRYARNSNLKNGSPALRENQDGKVLRPMMKENVERRNNGKSHNIKEFEKQEFPRVPNQRGNRMAWPR